MERPRILVARAVFPEVLERLRAALDVEANEEDQVLSPAELARRLADKDGVLTTGGDLVFVKNIDNLLPEERHAEVAHWKLLLAGKLLGMAEERGGRDAGGIGRAHV